LSTIFSHFWLIRVIKRLYFIFGKIFLTMAPSSGKNFNHSDRLKSKIGRKNIMRIYIGIDDTDNPVTPYGTGKVARWFEEKLPEGCHLEGVVRQQLLVHAKIPYTSHNSSACLMVHVDDEGLIEQLRDRAIGHVLCHASEGSDPGICVASEDDRGLSELMDFGRKCTQGIVTQRDALCAARTFHLSGHGGTNDGIIGAAAAVGLTASGWCGRFIEYGRLRSIPEILRVSDLEQLKIVVTSMDRDARVPASEDLVHNRGWLRPRLWGKRAVLPVIPKNGNVWESLGKKRKREESACLLTGIAP
jgi:hypothetical protein